MQDCIPSEGTARELKPHKVIEQDGVCHNWGVGRREFAIHWDRAFKPGATNLSKHFEGKPPP